MKMIRFLVVWFVFVVGFSSAQENSIAKQYASLIKSEELKDNLKIIASDALEGRYTGSRGQKMAAAFIANYFQEIGLEPPVNDSYYQKFEVYSSKPGNTYVKIGDTQFNNFHDVLFMGEGNSPREIKTDIIFAGFGREEDFAQLAIKDKSILILVDDMYQASEQQLAVTIARAKVKGVKNVFALPLFSESEFDRAMNWYEAQGSELTLTKPKLELGALSWFYVRGKVAEKIFNKTFPELRIAAKAEVLKKSLKKIKPADITYQVQTEINIINTENILGYLPGTDKKDEVVVITAHYDHEGKNEDGIDKIYNGADDDGSGTVAVMQLAKAFAEAKKNGNGPRRSVLFMTVAGEEEGLLGSEYYADHPVFPLANTVADLNIDMIGRSVTEYQSNKNYVYVIGSDKLSSELHSINEQMNNSYTHLNFDYTFNDESHPDRLYYRSDHWNFAKNGIPIIFYFDGIHEDYHKVTDEVSKIDFDLLTLRAQCVFYTAWEVANREVRLKIDKR